VSHVNTTDRVKGSSEDVAGPIDPSARSRPRDTQRSRVYRAEEAWAARLDAARHGARFARVGGSNVLVPAERRFGDLVGAATYGRALLAQPDVVRAFGRLPAPELRPRRGGGAAHWEPPGTIAVHVPEHGEPWALRESVLLHELGHHVGHLTGRTPHHAAPFPAIVLLLVQAALGEHAAFALRVDYGEQRVRLGALIGDSDEVDEVDGVDDLDVDDEIDEADDVDVVDGIDEVGVVDESRADS
jgi:putative metallohydrolase (TIGR04338 family)